MIDVFGYCESIYYYWPGRSSTPESRTPGLFIFTLGCLQFLCLALIAVYLFREWRKARSPMSFLYNESAFQETLIFPIYFKILALCGLAALWTGIVNLVFPVGIMASNPLSISLLYGSSWGFYHWVIEGIAFLMLSAGVGSKSATRATIFGFLFGLLTFLTAGYSFYMVGSLSGAIADTLLNGILFVFYGCLWLAPAKSLFRRPAIYEFARFWTINKGALLIANWLIYFKFSAGYCLNELSSTGILSAIIPYLCYSCLQRDARYWQGLLHLESSNVAEIRKPLLGTSLDPSSARAIASRIDSTSFTSGRASNGGGTVRILNFAFLKIDQLAPEYSSNRDSHAVIGAGSSSRVFRGTYKGRRVAIKMIFCPELTAETISTFYHEATLLASLAHSNVVEIIGVCVLPPSICLVMELCDGNLFDYLKSDFHSIKLETQLGLVFDMSNSLSFLHTRDTPVLHLDIKSSNFLIVKTAAGRIGCKVADLEWSREIVVAETEMPKKSSRPNSVPQSPALQSLSGHDVADESDVLANAVAIAPDDRSRSAADGTVAHLLSGSQLSGFKMPETIYWLAPELMMGRAYSEKADIYSLSMVIWEIFTGLVPFKEVEEKLMNKMQENIRAAMIASSPSTNSSPFRQQTNGSFNGKQPMLDEMRGSENSSRSKYHHSSNPNSQPNSLNSVPHPALTNSSCSPESLRSHVSLVAPFAQTALSLVAASNQTDIVVETVKTPLLTAESVAVDNRPADDLELQLADQTNTFSSSVTSTPASGPRNSGSASPVRRRLSDSSLSVHVPRLHKLDPKDIRISELLEAENKIATRKARKARKNDHKRGSSVGDSPPPSNRSSAVSIGSIGSPAFPSMTNSNLPSFSSHVFVSKQQVQQQLQLLICVRNYRPPIPISMPQKLKELITRGWAPNPRDRPSAVQFVKICEEIRLESGFAPFQ